MDGEKKTNAIQCPHCGKRFGLSTHLGELVKTNPAKAKKEVLTALRNAGANAVLAAKTAGVTPRTWTRWIVALDLEVETEEMRRTAKAKGWWRPTPNEKLS